MDTTTPILTGVRSPYPDEDTVCGSVRDYFQEVSDSMGVPRFEPHYWVINPDSAGYPVWLPINQSFANYSVFGLDSMFHDVVYQAVGVQSWSLDGYDDLCVIVANHHYNGSPGPYGVAYPTFQDSLYAPDICGAYYSAEMWGTDFNNPGDPDDPECFTHVGVHCHEYGHMLGLSFSAPGPFGGGNHNGKQFMLMGSGNNPGPQHRGESPSHMGVAEKLELNWVNTSGLNQELFEIDHDFLEPNEMVIPYRTDNHRWFYRFLCPGGTKFYLENRRFDGLEQAYPNDRDFNSYLTGYNNPNMPRNMLLVQRVNLSGVQCDMLCADNSLVGQGGVPTDPIHWWWHGDWGDPFPGMAGLDSLTPMSVDTTEYWGYINQQPYTYHYHTTTKNISSPITIPGNLTGLAIFNIRSESDGIHAEVYHNYWAGDMRDFTTWSGDDIIVGGPYVKVFQGKVLTISPGSVVTFRPSTKIISEGTTALRCDITQDFFIEGNVRIDSNITVAENATLTIYPGSHVKFAAGKKLTVNGRLLAVGTPSSNIYFQRNVAGSQYEGIEVDHTGPDPSENTEIKYCHISGARYGVLARSTAKLLIEHCTIEDNIIGVYGATAGEALAPQINWNMIRNNSLYGMAMDGMGFYGVIYHNSLFNNDEGNVYMLNSSPFTYGHNYHEGPGDFDLFCDGTSSPCLAYNYPGYLNGGYNQFRSCDYGIITRAQSRPCLGLFPSWPGQNSLYHQDIYMLDNRGSQNFYAQCNWWLGVDPEIQHPPFISNGQLVYSEHWLDELPEEPDGWAGPGPGGGTKAPVGQTDSPPSLLLQADQMLYGGNLGAAASMYLSALSLNPSVANGLWAVWGFNESNSLMGVSPPFLTQLNGVAIQFAANAIGTYAQFLVMLHLSATNPSGALSMANSLALQSNDPALAMCAAYKAAMLTKYALGDTTSGNSLFAEFIENYPGEDLANLAYLEVGLLPPGVEGNGGIALTILPLEYRFYPSFPNPFNSSTVLRYELRDASFVKLGIWDISGRLVAELVNGWRVAGDHQITFDGSALPSGIYFAKLEAGDYSLVQKLILLK